MEGLKSLGEFIVIIGMAVFAFFILYYWVWPIVKEIIELGEKLFNKFKHQ